MQEKLIIYLHAVDLYQPGWAVVEANGQIRQSVYRDQPDGLAMLASQKEVIVIVPAEDVTLVDVSLPKMPRSRLAQAIPYALEEQLIDDVESMHFAFAEPTSDGNVSVAIVAQSKMQQWMDLLQAWNIRADLMTPAMLTLPFSPDAWHVMIDEIAVVRTGLKSGFGSDKQNLDTYLNLALSNAAPLPQQVVVRNYTSHAIAADLNSTVPITEEFIPSEQMMEDIAGQIANHPTIDLLQSIYSTKKKNRLTKLTTVWKAATYLGISLLVLLFLYPTGSYIILKQRDSVLQNQISDIYHRHFPGKAMVAPKIRMEDKLHKLQSQTGENQLLLLLGYVGKGMAQTSGIQLKRFDFQNGQLTVELNAKSSDNFSSFSGFLTAQGLQVKQQNAVLSGERVNATLQIE